MSAVAAQAEEKAKEVERKIREFFDKANETLSWVPGPLTHLIQPIIEGLQKIDQKLRELWDKLDRFLISEHGEPGTLKNAGEAWVSKIGNPTYDVAGDIALPKLRTNLEWDGRAAEAYKAIVPAQADGLKGIKSLAEQLRNSLTKLADAIENFWTSVLLALGAFIVSIGLAAIEAAGIITLPGAIPTILAGAGAALALITVAVTQTMSMVDTIEGEQTAITQKIHDLGNEWTQSSVDLGDATESDGDPSNWQVDS